MKELEDIRSQVEVFLKNHDWIKWVHFGVPDKEGATRDKIRDELAVLFHCKKCTALSGCYFVLNNMPGILSMIIVIALFMRQMMQYVLKHVVILESLRNMFLQTR